MVPSETWVRSARQRERRNKKNKKNVTPRTQEPKLQKKDRVMSTSAGTKYMVVDVAGGDRCCRILALIALNMFRENIPLEDIVSFVSGNSRTT